MRVAFAALVRYAPLLVLPATTALESRIGQVDGLTVLEYNAETAYTRFSIFCPDCFAKGQSAVPADETLLFDFQISPTGTDESPVWNVTFTGSELALPQDDAQIVREARVFSVLDNSANDHPVNITWFRRPAALWPSDVLHDRTPGFPESEFDFVFFINSVDISLVDGTNSRPDQLNGFVITQAAAEPRLTRLTTLPHYQQFLFADLKDSRMSNLVDEIGDRDGNVKTGIPEYEDVFDFDFETESLGLLEAQAEDLRLQIAAKKHAISNHLRQHRDAVELKALIEECDGIVCAAKVIAQRLCDMVGLSTEMDFDHAQSEYHHLQHTISFDEETHRPQQASRNCTKSKTPGMFPAQKFSSHGAASNMPVVLTKNESSHTFETPSWSSSPEPYPLLRVLHIVAAALGLAAIAAFLRRSCMSMRKRVERAADKEARRNERAYRRAARRVLLRKRWDSFISTFSCFRRDPEPTGQDYEEKRALILQDAFLEQDLDAAEKGEVMEAEIRELRYAHEIISSLVRVDDHRYELITPVHNPPPPLVPLPYTSATRSRASTGTLPSYTSEGLPEYSSQPSEGARSSRSSSIVVDGFTLYTPSESDEEDALVTSSTTANRERTKYTPTSSILETSPRVSEDTVRTLQSRNA